MNSVLNANLDDPRHIWSAWLGKFRSAADTCPIQSCNRFTASSWRFAISDLMSKRSSPAE
jgi:hypothetical protein